MSANSVDLRQNAFRGGLYLVARQIFAILLKIIGVFVITRLLGPSAYGAYVSATGIYQYLLLIGQAGVGVYLLREKDAITPTTYGMAYTILMVMAISLTGLFLAFRLTLSEWIDVDGFDVVSLIVILALPLQLLSVPATVMLERQFNYKSIAMIEISALAVFYSISAPLAYTGYGAVSLAFAYVAQNLYTFIVVHYTNKTYPIFAFDRVVGKKIFVYAFSYSFSNWIWQLRSLVNPLIVGPAGGAQAVGVVGLTISLLDILSSIKTIAWRLSVAILSRFQDEISKLRKAIREGMELQALAIGTIAVGFGVAGEILVPWFFGERWRPVMQLYPYIALSYFTNALFNMHSSVLSLLRRNTDTALFHTAHIMLFASAAFIFVPVIGPLGYGYAEIAAMISYVVIHYFTVKRIGSIHYLPTLTWWLGVTVGLFWRDLGYWAIVVPFVALAIPPSPERISYLYGNLRIRRKS